MIDKNKMVKVINKFSGTVGYDVPEMGVHRNFYPKEYFSPFDNNSRTLKKTKNTYGIHGYTALWQSKQQRREYKKNVFKTRIVNAIQSLIGEEGYLKLRKKLFRR